MVPIDFRSSVEFINVQINDHLWSRVVKNGQKMVKIGIKQIISALFKKCIKDSVIIGTNQKIQTSPTEVPVEFD